MKKFNKDNIPLSALAFLVLPVIFFIAGNALRNVQGPFFLNFYDPSYVYLINSLNLAQLNGYGVGHFDHPGTTVQVAGAFIIKIYHALTSADTDFVTDVLTRPETYLHIINKVFLTLNCLALLFLGIFTFRISGNIFLSLLIQLSPFVSEEIFYGVIIDTPDNLLILASIFFIALLIFYLFKVEADKKSSMKFILLLALVCGFGLDTKLNFLPLFIIGLFIINGKKEKTLFVFFTLIAFLFFFFPVISNYGKFLNWIEALFFKSGHYGKGESTIIDTSTFAGNLILIFKKDKLFAFTYFLSLITLVIFPFFKINIAGGSKSLKFKKDLKLLAVIFFSVSIHIFLVAKHYAQYYMIPSFMLVIFILILLSFIWSEYLSKFSVRIRFNLLFTILFIVIAIMSTYKIIYSYHEGDYQKNEAYNIYNFLNDNYKYDIIISSFGSANQDCARAFGASYAASQTDRYNKIIRDIQKSRIFFNPWASKLYPISENINKEEIKNYLAKNKKIILQINIYGSVNEFTKILESDYNFKNVKTEKVFSNGNNEYLYEITFD